MSNAFVKYKCVISTINGMTFRGPFSISNLSYLFDVKEEICRNCSRNGGLVVSDNVAGRYVLKALFSSHTENNRKNFFLSLWSSSRQRLRCCFNVLMVNEICNYYNQFLLHSFLSALHVSNESSRSSSGAQHNILYYTVWYNRYTRAIRRV